MYRGLAGEGSLSLKNTCVVWFFGWFVFFRCCFLLIMDAFESAKQYLEACDDIERLNDLFPHYSADFYSSEEKAKECFGARQYCIQQAVEGYKNMLCVCPALRSRLSHHGTCLPLASPAMRALVLPHPEQNGEPKPLLRAGTPKRKREELEEVVADEKITSPQTTTTQVPYIAYILAGKIPPN